MATQFASGSYEETMKRYEPVGLMLVDRVQKSSVEASK